MMTASDPLAADRVIEAIRLALIDRDMPAVVGLLHVLAVKDPGAAEDILAFVRMLAGDSE